MTSLPLALLVAAAGAVTVTYLAWREHQRRQARHRAIFDPILGLFDNPKVTFAGNGLPLLEGNYKGQRLRVDLIPDNMTIRRLPQLWLSLTTIKPLPLRNAGIAALVRPSGNDYYSLTERMSQRLDIPASFPQEIWVRGESLHSRKTLDKITEAASRIFAEPKVKEIAATERGVRIVYQLAEGKRGNYLLLRQSEFVDPKLAPELLDGLAAQLSDLSRALT